jgi:hypothetical protein
MFYEYYPVSKVENLTKIAKEPAAGEEMVQA